MREYLPKDWTTKKSSEFCLRVADGTHDTPKPVDDGRLLITSKNLKNGRVDRDGAYMIGESDYQQINKRSKVDRWDVLFSMIGTVGEIALIRDEPDFAIKNIGLFKNRTKEDGTWLYYYLTSSIGQAALDTFLSGTSQQFVALGDLRNVPVIVPTDTSKKKVTAILSAYDEVIENNRRHIALLEKLAEEIYREWFVRLRFPGHLTAKLVKGVPDGWVVDRVDSIGRVVTGKTPPTTELRYYGDQFPFIKTPDMHGNMFALETEECLSLDGYRFQQSQSLPEGSICVSCIGTAGIVSITTRPSQTNQQINSVIPNQTRDLEWAFFTLKGLREMINLYGATGATMTNLSKGKFSALSILRPPAAMLDRYHELAGPIFSQIKTFMAQNIAVEKIRELLLPRLISGKLSVENLDIQFPPGTAEELNEAPAGGSSANKN